MRAAVTVTDSMGGRSPLRVGAVGVVGVAMLGSTLVGDVAPADAFAGVAVSGCRSFPVYSEEIHGALIPGTMPAPDPAIIEDDPDAESMPMVIPRYPDETGLWADSGTRGTDLVIAASTVDTPIGTPTGLGPQRADPEISDSIVRLYCGLFGREADGLEVEYWARRYWNGLPLASIAEAFTTSREFIERHGDPSDEALITILYRSILGREPGAGGVEPFLEMLHSAELTRGSLVVAFTDSPEYVAATGTAKPEKPPLPYPAVGSGRRIIYANREARVWFIEETGELTKTHQVSGRRGVPTPDRYNVYSKSRYAWAPHDDITMEYMVRFAREEWPYGFHSIPINPDNSPLQTKEQLGTLRSGGCVRQDFDDAEFTFEWADVGTRVIMLP
jgi:hypothetical protein